ncbi:MAG: hypothetical protein ABFS45_22030 [Pseudomonadota bacterium]
MRPRLPGFFHAANETGQEIAFAIGDEQLLKDSATPDKEMNAVADITVS